MTLVRPVLLQGSEPWTVEMYFIRTMGYTLKIKKLGNNHRFLK
jgi:hypothetical protein